MAMEEEIRNAMREEARLHVAQQLQELEKVRVHKWLYAYKCLSCLRVTIARAVSGTGTAIAGTGTTIAGTGTINIAVPILFLGMVVDTPSVKGCRV